MNPVVNLATLCLLIFILSSKSLASEDTSDNDSALKNDVLRCERFTKSNLKELKKKLQDYCNLEKPFSTNLSVNLGEEHFMYCCHKKK